MDNSGNSGDRNDHWGSTAYSKDRPHEIGTSVDVRGLSVDDLSSKDKVS